MLLFIRAKIPCLLAISAVMTVGAIAPPAGFAADLEIRASTEAFENRELASEPVRVTVSYQPYDFETMEDWSENLSYQIFYGDMLYISSSQPTFYNGVVSLQDLNGNGVSEVIVETFSGGAHCCTNFTIYAWQGDAFIRTETGLLDGGGGTFEDLNDNGSAEFVSFDQSFLYTFSSYAGSFPPSLILSLQDGQFQDVTPQHEAHLRGTAWRMYQSVLQAEVQGYEINGVLAGYVAQKIRLGEYEQGWEFMLARYDRDSDWGLEIYSDQGDPVGRYADFPSALIAFLQQTGYLDADGSPNPNVNRAPSEGYR
jgi:hypothetical protein